MKRSTRLSLATATTLALTGALLGPASPSSAFTGNAIKVKLGQDIKVTKAAIPGNSTVFQANYTTTSALPADCAGEPVGCEVVPIQLDIPQQDPDAIEAQGYILTVVVDWDPGQRVDNAPEVGQVFLDDLESFLYQDPLAVDSAGKATYTARSNTTQPSSLIAVSPTSNKFQLVVANFTGVNNGYTLDISLTSAAKLAFDPNAFGGKTKTPDYVQPTFVPPAPSSPQQAGFGGASGPAFFPSSPTAPAPAAPVGFTVPNIMGGKADPSLLTMGVVDVRSGLGLRAVDVTSKVSGLTTDKSTGRSVLVGLLVLPLLIGLFLLFLLARKRGFGRSSAPAVA